MSSKILNLLNQTTTAKNALKTKGAKIKLIRKQIIANKIKKIDSISSASLVLIS